MGYVTSHKEPAATMHRHTVSNWKLLGAGFFVGVGWSVGQAIIISLCSPSFAKLCSAIGDTVSSWF